MVAGLPGEPPRLTRPDGPLPGIGIVHLGLGAFFRAHGAIYVEEAMAKAGGDWGIIGVSLRNPDIRNALAPQGGLYTAVALAPGGPTARSIGSVQHVLVAPEDPETVLAAMAAPGVRIVTLTVTEKGYCHEPATGHLNLAHPDILHDLTHLHPVSAPGYLVRALQRRWAAGQPPFTVLTCDNLPANGALVRRLVLEMADRIDPALAGWIAAEGRFPSTMVDRIVPATTPDNIARTAAMIGAHDAAPVMHEPFRQWVIEDDFVGGQRPDLGSVGAQMVEDVAPYELMKLRMLNGTHSSLAYLGYLGGHQTVAACMADPPYLALVRRLWADEIIPALTPPPEVDLADYARALENRYANPAIQHRTWQIAMDGSQKLPQRILGTLATNLAVGRASPGLTLAVAAWMRYVGGSDERGQLIDVRDPMAPRLRAICDSAPEGRVVALLALTEIFPPALATALAPGLTAAYDHLEKVGARRAVESLT
jgi:fructuronate reductase